MTPLLSRLKLASPLVLIVWLLFRVLACPPAAGEHLLDRVRGGDCRQQGREEVPSGVPQQHAGKGVCIVYKYVFCGTYVHHVVLVFTWCTSIIY